MLRRYGASFLRLFRTTAALATFPLLLDGSGCSTDVPVGSDNDPVKPGDCSANDCAGLAADSDAKLCSDGTALGRTLCTRNGGGQCFWDFPPCSVDAGPPATCTLADCAGKPVQEDAKLCPDGTGLGRTICAKNAAGICSWDFPACPTSTASDAAPTPSDTTDCGCVPDMQWGPNGGLVAYQETSSISACKAYEHNREVFRTDGGNLSCRQTLLGCGSGLRSGRDIVAILDRPDVQNAIKAKKVLYGVDSRPVDGQVFRIEVGGAIIEVGSPCQSSPTCVAIPAGISALVAELKAIDDQELGFEPCASTFPNR